MILGQSIVVSISYFRNWFDYTNGSVINAIVCHNTIPFQVIAIENGKSIGNVADGVSLNIRVACFSVSDKRSFNALLLFMNATPPDTPRPTIAINCKEKVVIRKVPAKSGLREVSMLNITDPNNIAIYIKQNVFHYTFFIRGARAKGSG